VVGKNKWTSYRRVQVSISVKHVRFKLDDICVHEVTPYADIYGAHPRTFNFDKDSKMIEPTTEDDGEEKEEDEEIS
jgi:hypothetical protein